MSNAFNNDQYALLTNGRDDSVIIAVNDRKGMLRLTPEQARLMGEALIASTGNPGVVAVKRIIEQGWPE